MVIRKARFLLFPSLLGLMLAFLIGCGSEPIPAAAPLEASTDGAQSQSAANSSEEVAAADSMEKTGDAMAKDTMAKTGDSISKDTMAKTGDAMARDTMTKTGDSMAKDTMGKTGDAMAKDTMAKTGDPISKDTMAKTGDAMAKDTMAKTSEAMAKDGMAKTGDTMAKVSNIGPDVPGENLALEIPGLQPLQNGFHYEGWAIIDGSPVSTGKFNISLNGDLMDLNGKVVTQGQFGVGIDLTRATVIALTIEPSGDSDSMPSGVKYLAGDLSGDSANLSVAHAAALGDDFTGASGAYILATPTDGADSNETSGIWYIDLSSGNPMPGLDLPALPPTFEYEGWVIIDGTPVSTGKFSDVAAADSGNPYSGPEDGKPFPGEDFLRNAPAGMTFPVELRGKVAAISIEPVPDDSPAPFALKPLVGGIGAEAEPFTNYQLDNHAGGFPAGSATIK